VSEWDNMFI